MDRRVQLVLSLQAESALFLLKLQQRVDLLNVRARLRGSVDAVHESCSSAITRLRSIVSCSEIFGCFGDLAGITAAEAESEISTAEANSLFKAQLLPPRACPVVPMKFPRTPERAPKTAPATRSASAKPVELGVM